VAWRFHRRIKIMPGFDINLGKTGASLSVGMRGLHTTFGRRMRTTIGLPGSGLSYTALGAKHRTSRTPRSFLVGLAHFAFWAFVLWVLWHH
jgi:hypothetical protein